jgi:hypothetical protein
VEPRRKVWREGFAPGISAAGLGALRAAHVGARGAEEHGGRATMLIPSRILAVHQCCGGEGGRYTFAAVQFGRDADGRCWAAATDEVVLLAADWDDGGFLAEGPAEHMPTPGFSQLVPAAAVRRLAELVGGGAGGAAVLGEPGGAGYALSAADRPARLTLTGPCAEGKFPPWRDVLKTPPPPADQPGPRQTGAPDAGGGRRTRPEQPEARRNLSPGRGRAVRRRRRRTERDGAGHVAPRVTGIAPAARPLQPTYPHGTKYHEMFSAKWPCNC